MGARADFYIGEGIHATWLGSVAWDGYEWAEDAQCSLMKATTQDEFVAAVTEISTDREDWTSPSDGWPWPWNDSTTTDRAYAFVDGKTVAYEWGKVDDESPDIEWPDMSDVKNVARGVRSGLIVIGPNGIVE